LIYTVEKATLLAEQLRRFTTGYGHHLAGQFANIEFWIAEVESALKALDEYGQRFTRMRDAQREWVEGHGTVVNAYCEFCHGKCEFSDGVPTPPVRTADEPLKEARRALSDAGYELLLRCYRQQLLAKEELEALCLRIDSGLDPSDLRPK
jgi:hypothetical protein